MLCSTCVCSNYGMSGAELTPICCNVSVAEGRSVPPLSEVLVLVVGSFATSASLLNRDFEGYLEPNVPDTTRLVVAYVVTTVRDNVTIVQVLNPKGTAVELTQELHIGDLYSLEGVVVTPSLSSSDVCTVQPPVLPVTLEESPISYITMEVLKIPY